jgi:hypothetical protein
MPNGMAERRLTISRSQQFIPARNVENSIEEVVQAIQFRDFRNSAADLLIGRTQPLAA